MLSTTTQLPDTVERKLTTITHTYEIYMVHDGVPYEGVETETVYPNTTPQSVTNRIDDIAPPIEALRKLYKTQI